MIESVEPMFAEIDLDSLRKDEDSDVDIRQVQVAI
jgi:hypothetical protein